MFATQEETDRLVERCKKAIAKYGKDSDELAGVRKYYEMFRRCAEHGAMVAVEAELDKVGC